MWQRAEVAAAYQQSRTGIPFADAHFEHVHRMLDSQGLVVRSMLDLGCGDGTATLAMLGRETIQRATLVDFSEPMLERARANLANARPEVRVLHGDLLNPAWRTALDHGASFDLVISRFAIHHLPHTRKQELYGEILNLLRPGGVFVNIEHVKSASPDYERAFERMLIEGIHATQTDERELAEVEAAFHDRWDAEINILATVEDQLDWLRALGFVDVDCLFKALELAVLVGRNPANPDDQSFA